MGTKAQLRAYLDAQDGHVGGAKYWEYVYGWSGGGLPFCAVGVSAALKATDTKCAYFPSKVAFDRRDKSVIGSRWVNRDNLEYLDAIAFDWDADGSGDHVGFFIEYLGGGKCRTFEFNVSNSCGYRTRYVSDIIGGIRPRYKEDEVTDADIQKIAKAVWSYQIDYKNGADDKPHKASAASRLGYIDYESHPIIRKLDEIIKLLTGGEK